MITISPLLNFITAFAAFSGAVIIWLRYQKSVWKNLVVYRFFLSFLISGIFFLIEASTGSLTRNTVTIQALYIIAESLMMFMVFFLLSIPLTIFSGNTKLSTIFGFPMVIYGTFYLFYNLIFIKPAVTVISGRFIDWQNSANPILQIIFWTLAGSGAIAFAYLFIKNGWHHPDTVIRLRSRLIGGGCSVIIVGMIFMCLFMTLPKSAVSPQLATLASIFIGTGYFFMLIGVLQKGKEMQ